MPVTRAALLAAGLALLALLWGGPLPGLTDSHFSAHMLLHMSVVAVAAPLLALGLAGTAWDPARRWPVLFSAVPASVAELVAVWVWHAPTLHRAARLHEGVLVAEQATFLVAGLWLWMSACGGDLRREPHRIWSGVAGLLFTSIHMTLLGALFALAPDSIYTPQAGAASAADQHLGGSLMLLIGGVSYLAGGLGLAMYGLQRAPRPSSEAPHSEAPHSEAPHSKAAPSEAAPPALSSKRLPSRGMP
ncbi:MAG: cytochrome c oxidase assembly protein [Vicinamibacterales bacterium]